MRARDLRTGDLVANRDLTDEHEVLSTMTFDDLEYPGGTRDATPRTRVQLRAPRPGRVRYLSCGADQEIDARRPARAGP